MRLASIGLAVAISSPVFATAAQFNFINRCPFMVNMWDNAAITNITARNGVVSLDANGKGLMWRHGYDPQATLAEVTVDLGTIWYDISAIPPGTGNCSSYDNCNDPTIYHGSKGFNVALAMVPRANINGANCRPLVCLSGRCNDAFLYPYDNSKVHSCPDTTPFDIIFCPGGIIDISKPRATVPPMPRPDDDNNNTGGNNNNGSGNTNNSGGANNNTGGNTNNSGGNNSNGGGNTNNNGGSSTYKNAFYEYTDDQAGNVPGFYNRVTDLATCSRQRIDVVNPVGPLSEEVTMVFRGPMEIYNIAVYGASPTTWPRLSSYTRGGPSENLVFFNNKNIDYSGLHLHGPQIFASSDGNGTSTTPKVFNGSLADAANPNDAYSGPGISTGVEVNIMTAQRCGISDCRGYSAGDYNYRGWSGDRKIFVTRVKMPMSGSRPNMPAIWMLNAQVMYTGQYSPCNCRGQGAVGGCGELDIAEVIDNGNPRLNRISTHYYFYDGQVQSAPYGDNYASRPIDRTATYVTIFDATAKDGLIKILEIDDSTFDFSADSLTNAQVQRWISSTA